MNDINIFDFFLKSSGLAKLTMLILMYLSITSWSIIIHRSHILISATRKASMFEDKFGFDIKLSCMELYRLYQEKQTRGERISGSEKIFYAGFQEFTRLHRANNYDPERIVEGAARAMRIAMNRELEALETHIPFLGTVGSISPYIGLFGTVWGILHAFIGLSTVKNPTLQIVAPGIAEALITTAIGLFASIPAVIAFNRLNLQVNKLEQRYDNFIEELIATLYGQALVKASAK